MMIQIEYCSGHTLEDYLSERNQKHESTFVFNGKGVIDRGQNLEIFTHVMRGMAEIHKNGILHRDLKPENIFIGEKEGKLIAKVGDFGLARILGQDERGESP